MKYVTSVKKIRKRDGRIVDFEPEKIEVAVSKALRATNKNEKLARAIASEVVKEIEERFENSIPSVEDVQDVVEAKLIKGNLPETAKAYILYRKKREEIREVKQLFGVKDDLKLGINSVKVLEKRYLLKDEQGNVIETPSQLFRRVARAVASCEKERERWEEKFYKMLTSLEFLPNSPTLMNAGTELGQLSACFVLPVEDSIEGIFSTLKLMAVIHKSGGGTGFNFSKLRPEGDVVGSTKGVASGPVSFMKIFDVSTEVIKQGGRRRGANMGILNVNHPDIIRFITSKEKEGELSNFNLSVAVDREFMGKVEKNEDYALINPRTNEVVEELNAKDVFELIVTQAWKTGDPGMIFLDRINEANPTPNIAKIEATNPCVTADTFISTTDGVEQVKDLIGKKFSAIVNGERFESEKGFFLTGKKPVYRLKTKEGFEVRLTKDHRVLAAKKITKNKIITEWVPAGELKKGDKIVLNNHKTLEAGSRKTKGGGYLVFPHFLGFLVGERPAKRRSLAYCAATLPHSKDFKGSCRVSRGEENSTSLLSLNGIIEKASYHFRTGFIEKVSYDFRTGFLRGLFDCNGSVHNQLKGVSKRVSIRLSQSNMESLKAVQRMLLRLGIFSRIYEDRRSGKNLLPNRKGGYKEYKYNLKEYNLKARHELVISKENILEFYKKIGFEDVEKLKKLESIIKSYRRKMKRERFVATFEELVPDGFEDVYDTTVKSINAFDGNGFILHNCGEQPLLAYESCNLGSINLVKMFDEKKKEVDWEKLRERVRDGVRFLDNVIEVNKFPAKEIKELTKSNRKIGLGVMGFAELLLKLSIPYDSDDALKVGERIMKFISEEGIKASEELAKERGSFPNFKGSLWEKKGVKAMRNATITTVAPTGTISIIANTSSGIEPLFALCFVRNVMGGVKLLEINSIFEKVARERGFYSSELMTEIAKKGSVQEISGIPEDVKKVFVTALDIAPEWHVKMQAVFQKYVDNAVSKTVNLPANAKIEDVRNIFMLAYKLGCKGITIYRYGSKKEQVLSISPAFLKEPVIAEAEFAGGCPTETPCNF